MKSESTDIARGITDSGNAMPDVADAANPQPGAALQWVGMEGIALPVRLDLDTDQDLAVPARASVWVNLPDVHARGIHMSRLYTRLGEALDRDALTACALRKLLRALLDSHNGLSDRVRLRLEFDLLLRRDALKSARSGWKTYPVSIDATMDRDYGHCHVELACRVEYSSTCPASAALSRQLIQQRFDADFDPAKRLPRADVRHWLGSAEGICATPHSQRSAAQVRVRLQAGLELPLNALIEQIEAALMTPLQTVVKREDEQEFARLNGENPMFCEDAARRIHAALDGDARYADFHIRAAHFESLHPHDAVAIAVKGVARGYGRE